MFATGSAAAIQKSEPPGSAKPSPKSLPWIHLVWIVVLAVAVAALSLKKLPLPFTWMGLEWAVALFAMMFFVRGTWTRVILFHIGFFAVLVAGAEAYLALHESPAPAYSTRYKVLDDVLGYAPVKGVVTHATRSDGKALIYDVTYNIDANGLRVSPPWQKDNLTGTALFFGCSFTLGEGLHDDETLAYQVGSQSEGRYRTFNFGFHGYGPHQMLAAIEHGTVSRIVDTRPQYVFYTAIPNHVVRVAGKVNYGKHAPRYLLQNAEGEVYQAGHFDDAGLPQPKMNPELSWQLNKSAIYRMFTNLGEWPSDDDIRLLFGVVRKSKELLGAQYPGVQFHVILWPGVVKSEAPIYRKLRAGFREMGVGLDVVEEIIPDYAADPSKYLLGGGDRHPNALANRLVAHYLLENVIAPHSAASAK
jgi:hypothetical protein